MENDRVGLGRALRVVGDHISVLAAGVALGLGELPAEIGELPQAATNTATVATAIVN